MTFNSRVDSDDALIQQKRVLALPEPNRTSLRELCHFNEIDLHGRVLDARKVWGSRDQSDSSADDLVGLCELHEVDWFSKIMTEDFVQWLHEHIVRRWSKSVREENPLVEYNHRAWLRFTKLITTVVACLLPVLFISVLYSIRSMRSRLTAIACFNVLSTICLNVFTTAKRVEIFAVTAAWVCTFVADDQILIDPRFAAVEVVFISSNGNTGP